MELVTFTAQQVFVMPKYGLALQERRELVGYRTQSDLARAVRSLEHDGILPGDLRTFSQQWLSTLEDDRTGEALLSARPRQIRALAYMLKWSGSEFEENVGVSIGSVPHFDTPKPANAATAPKQDSWILPKSSARPIPASLTEAAQIFGDRPEWAELRQYRWQRFLTDLHHRRTPQSAEDWLALYLDLRERFDPPEEESGSFNS